MRGDSSVCSSHDTTTHGTDVEQGHPRPVVRGPPSQPYGPPPPGYEPRTVQTVQTVALSAKLGVSSQRALAALDLDKNGRVSTGEVLAAAEALAASREEGKFLKKALVLVVCAFVLGLAGTFGVTLVALEVAKEARVAPSHVLVADDGAAVQVASTDLVTAHGELRARSDAAAVKTAQAETRLHVVLAQRANSTGRRLMDTAAEPGEPSLVVACAEAAAALRDHERAATTPLTVELWPGTTIVATADTQARLGAGFELAGSCAGGACHRWTMKCPAEDGCECAVAVTWAGEDSGAEAPDAEAEGGEDVRRLLETRALGNAFCWEAGLSPQTGWGMLDASGACAPTSIVELANTYLNKVTKTHPCSAVKIYPSGAKVLGGPDWCDALREADIPEHAVRRILPGSGVAPGGDQWRIDGVQSGVMSHVAGDDADATGAKFQLGFSGYECKSSDTYLGTMNTADECARAAKSSGASFFIFGTGGKAGRCYAEHTSLVTCPEGFESDSYDFYFLMGAQLRGRPGELANADFSDDTVVDSRGYEYRAPTGWTTRHRRRTGTVLVKHGNDAWGLAKNQPKFSENLLALQGHGAFVEQAVANLEPEQQYTVTFLSASRRGHGDDEMLTVSADGQELLTVHPWDTSSAQDGANKYSVVFTAAKATATIRFENTSPAGDKTVFVTRVEIGATCAMPKGPADWNAAYINPAHARDSGAVRPPQPTMEGWGLFYEVDCQCWGSPRDHYHLGFLNRYESVHMTYGSLRDQALALKIALGNHGRHPCAVQSTGLGWCAGTFGLHMDDWQGMRNAKESCGAPESDPFYSR